MQNSMSAGQRTQRFVLLFLFALIGAIILFVPWAARTTMTVAKIGAMVSWQYAFLALFTAACLLSFAKRLRSRLFWEVVFTLTVFLGIWYLFLFLLPIGFALACASLLTLAHLFLRNVLAHDVLYLLGAAGVAINLAGWLSPEVLLAILVVMTLYDTVSGPPGGPIEDLARMLVSRGIVPGFILISRPRDVLSSIDDMIRSDAALLGAGDVILPMCLVARASFAGPFYGGIVLVGLIGGVLVLARRTASHPRAALPALAVGAAVPFLALRLLSLI